MKTYARSALLITALISTTLSYGYEVILTEIINNTPNTITYLGKHTAEPARPMELPGEPPVESAPPVSHPAPIIIPARSRKIINTQIVNDAESSGIAELFFNFKDKNGNIVSAIGHPGKLFKFAPLLGWEREGMDFTDPKGVYRVQFVFEGKDGIANMKIQPASRRRRTMRGLQKRMHRKY